MRITIIYTIIMFHCIISYAQVGDYATIDRRIKTLTVDNKITIPALVKTITLDCPTPQLKARAVYDWILLNIKYDYDKLYHVNTHDYLSDPALILQQRKGICIEFATLAQRMFKEAGIPCEIVIGSVQNDTTHELESHAWNAIELAGKWQLLELTWAANEKGITGEISEAYYLVPPDQFIWTHRPYEKNWSLLDSIPSLDEFTDYPFIYGNYFLYAEKPYPTHRTIIATKGELQLRRYLRAEFEEVLSLYKDGLAVADLKNGKISGLEKGEYDLVVGINHKPDEEGGLPYIIDLVKFQVIVP